MKSGVVLVFLLISSLFSVLFLSMGQFVNKVQGFFIRHIINYTGYNQK